MRLTEEDQVLARELRARGVSISDVVRRALRVEAASYAATPKQVRCVHAGDLRRHQRREFQTLWRTPDGKPLPIVQAHASSRRKRRKR